MRKAIKGLLAVGVGVLITSEARAQNAPPGAPEQPAQPPARSAPGRNRVQDAAPPAIPSRSAPQPGIGQYPADGNKDVLPGPIDSPQDVLETARLLFALTDTNGDGQISQKEAVDAGNLLVGGFFFRADQNGDGTLTKEEAQQARDALFQQQPLLRFIVARADRTNTPRNGAAAPGGNANAAQNEIKPSQISQMIGSLLDTNNDRKLEATEVRQAVQTGVQSFFAMADNDRNNQISPEELNQAAYNLAREGLAVAFQAADTDKNGNLSKEEFAKAIVQPGYTVFDIVDRNLDGQLTQDEIDSAMQTVVRQVSNMGVRPAANSPARLFGNDASERR